MQTPIPTSATYKLELLELILTIVLRPCELCIASHFLLLAAYWRSILEDAVQPLHSHKLATKHALVNVEGHGRRLERIKPRKLVSVE